MHLKLPAELYNKLLNDGESRPIQAKIISILNEHYNSQQTPHKIKGAGNEEKKSTYKE